MIEVHHLCKHYGNQKAVDDISFTIEKGHVYGLLGSNGAGKSTTMNILTGCLAASSGDVKIGGFDIFEEPGKAKKRIGYLPENPPLYQEMTVREYLSFVAEAREVPKEEQTEAVASRMLFHPVYEKNLLPEENKITGRQAVPPGETAEL